jgi:hypothetical protein
LVLQVTGVNERRRMRNQKRKIIAIEGMEETSGLFGVDGPSRDGGMVQQVGSERGGGEGFLGSCDGSAGGVSRRNCWECLQILSVRIFLGRSDRNH